MLTQPLPQLPDQLLRSIVHPLNTAPPRGTVLVDLLPQIERRIAAARNLPTGCGSLFNPLWYFADMERNVFLWHHGLELDQKRLFEFWIDPAALLAKRLRQISEPSNDNPFTNPVWGSDKSDPELTRREQQYLLGLESGILPELVKMHAISIASSALARELGAAAAHRIILPCGSGETARSKSPAEQ